MAKKDKDYSKALKEMKQSLFSPPIHNFFKHLLSSGSTKNEVEPTRTGLSPDTLARALRDNLYFTQGKIPEVATHHEWYAALTYRYATACFSAGPKRFTPSCNRTPG